MTRNLERLRAVQPQLSSKMKKTNFDLYLDEQMKDPEFAARFERAGEAWEVALQLACVS